MSLWRLGGNCEEEEGEGEEDCRGEGSVGPGTTPGWKTQEEVCDWKVIQKIQVICELLLREKSEK